MTKGEADLGLDQQTWQRLADTVDLIVDPAALVNHVLPYSQLFGPNVVGTAELIRLALTTKQKPYTYVSTIGMGDQMEASTLPSSTPTSGSSARPAKSTTATPTATTTASGPARCCCAKPTTNAGCRWRCSAAT